MSLHTDRLRALAQIVKLRDRFEQYPSDTVTAFDIVQLCNAILRLERTLQPTLGAK